MPYIGASGILAMAKQADIDTEATTGFEMIAGLCTLEKNQGFIERQGITGILSKRKAKLGRYTVSGDISAEVCADTIGQMLASILPKTTATVQGATSAYLHTFQAKPSGALNFYTVIKGLLDDAGAKVAGIDRGFIGCVGSQLVFTAGNEDIFKAVLGMEGQDEVDSPTYDYSGLSLSTVEPFTFDQGSIEIADAANLDIENIECTIAHTIGEKKVFDATRKRKALFSKGIAVTGRASLLFENLTERANFVAGTARKLEIIFEGATIEDIYKYKLTLILPGIIWKEYPVGDLEGPENELRANVTFEAYYDVSSAYAIRAELINTATSAY